MDIDEYNERPLQMTLQQAYKAIYRWYKSNRVFLERYCSPENGFNIFFFSVINNLPAPEQATDLEIRLILDDVIKGYLEPCFQASDGIHKMGEYARAVFKDRLIQEDDLTPDELQALEETNIWWELKLAKGILDKKYFDDQQPD